MGMEAQCTCTWNEQSSAGKALLETDCIIFRGDFRLSVRFGEMTSIVARDGNLKIDAAEGKITLSLGPAAKKWADRILNPPKRTDKLGVKAGSLVSIVGLKDGAFFAELVAAGAKVAKGKSGTGRDILFVGAETRADLTKVASLRQMMKPSGALWIIFPKGLDAITAADVRSGGLQAGLVDVKVARFSERLTALKFMIRLKDR